MEGFWLVSYVILWIVVLCLGAVMLAHSRLLGILHHRFGPAHAKPLADGPDIGARLEALEASHLDRTKWHWPFPAEQDLLLLFISPQCQTCDRLMPHATDFARRHRDVRLALLSTLEDRSMNAAFIAYRRLGGLLYLNGTALADEMQVVGTPYAVWIGKDGVVRAKGLANHYEHLLSLSLEARQDRASPTTGAGEASEQVPSVVETQ